MNAFQFKKIAVGGTFDRLHKGHEALLTKAFDAGDVVVIGLTTDAMVKNKPFAETILPYEQRLIELKELLKKNGWEQRAEILPISDIFGNTLEDKTIDAMVVSPESRANAQLINRQRRSRQLPELTLIEVSFIHDIEGKPIASHRIRAGEMDRQGRVFTSQKLRLTPRSITDKERLALRYPLGKIIPGTSEKPQVAAKIVGADPSLSRAKSRDVSLAPLIITVGDLTTSSLITEEVIPSIAIVDLHIRRKRMFKHIEELKFPEPYHPIQVKNPRGNVSHDLFQTIASSITLYIYNRQRQLIEVVGEEDLAVLPAILLAPLESMVIYGQPSFDSSSTSSGFAQAKPIPQGEALQNQEGLVVVEVTEEKKEEVRKILVGLPQ